MVQPQLQGWRNAPSSHLTLLDDKHTDKPTPRIAWFVLCLWGKGGVGANHDDEDDDDYHSGFVKGPPQRYAAIIKASLHSDEKNLMTSTAKVWSNSTGALCFLLQDSNVLFVCFPVRLFGRQSLIELRTEGLLWHNALLGTGAGISSSGRKETKPDHHFCPL